MHFERQGMALWWWRVGVLRAKARVAGWVINHMDTLPDHPVVEGALRRLWGV